jgi:hypothetical protein
MEIFELLAAMFDLTFGIADVLSLIVDLASSVTGDGKRPR